MSDFTNGRSVEELWFPLRPTTTTTLVSLLLKSRKVETIQDFMFLVKNNELKVDLSVVCVGMK